MPTMTTSPTIFAKLARTAMAALAVFAFTAPLVTSDADARPGRGLSTGSRGVKTYNAPPSTQTAPGAAQGMQRSATPAPGQPGAASQSARPGAATAAAGQSRFGTGLMAGLLGAGLFGALLGAGMFGNLGSFTAIIGLLLQVALIGGIVYFAIAFFRSRRQPAAAGASISRGSRGDDQFGRQADVQRTGYQPSNEPMASPAAGGSRIGARIGGAAMGTTPLALTEPDFTAFERVLAVVQTAYGRDDVDALRSAATPEMVGYFQEELESNANSGVRNEIGEPKLLQGDLSEAWSEASGEYATVAMRYSLTDATVEIATGRVIEGSRTEPQEATELWTFVRRAGSGPAAWRLSAIQQVS